MAVRKVLISLEERLLRRIDRAARARGLSRSAYFADVAVRDLGAQKGPGADPSVRAAMADLDDLFRLNPVPDEDMTLAIRRMRDER